MVGLTEGFESFFIQLFLKIHTGHSHDTIPQIIVIGLAQVSYQSIRRIRAWISEKTLGVIVFDLLANDFLVLSQFFFENSLVATFG